VRDFPFRRFIRLTKAGRKARGETYQQGVLNFTIHLISFLTIVSAPESARRGE
jgi:hypothetical protein